MKYILFLTLLVSCSKKDSPKITPASGFSIEVLKNDKLSTGEVVAKPTTIAVIRVWDANGKELEIKSTSDAIDGYAFDKRTQASVKANYTSIISPMSKETLSGRYFVFVSLGDVGVGRYAYSYTNFDIIEGEFTVLKKVFTTHATTGSLEAWNATE